MPSILVNAEDRLVVDRLYSAWQRLLQPTGPLLYQMPTIATVPDGRLLYLDTPTTFLAILTQNAILYEESGRSA
jgi:hypothetical protein